MTLTTVEPSSVDDRDEPQSEAERPHQHPGTRRRRDRSAPSACAPRASTTASTCSARPPAALAIATLLFGWIAPLSGVVGFIVVAFLAFVAIYALLVELRPPTGARWPTAS